MDFVLAHFGCLTKLTGSLPCIDMVFLDTICLLARAPLSLDSIHPWLSLFGFKPWLVLLDFLVLRTSPFSTSMFGPHPCMFSVPALSWWQNLPLVSWIVGLNHSGRLSRCLALARTPPSHLRCCWLKLKAHVLLMETYINSPMETKKGKSDELLKILLEEYKKGPKSNSS